MNTTLVVVLVIFFVIGSAIDNLRKAGKGTGAPQRPRLPPGPGMPPAPRPGAPGSTTPSERAEALVPEDLWALLTGQQRPAPAPPRRSSFELPQRAPQPSPPEGRSSPEPWAQGEGPPDDSSLEAEPPAPEAGPVPALQSAAQAAAQPLSVPQRVLTRPAPAMGRMVEGLRGPRELRRAMVLQVVLGPPKALE